MVEQYIWIVTPPSVFYFKMQMCGCCTSCSPCQSNHLTSFHFLTHLYKVFRLMTVKGFKAIFMFNFDAVSMAQ